MENRRMKSSKICGSRNAVILPLILFIFCIGLGYNYMRLNRDLNYTLESNEDLNLKVKSFTMKIASLQQEFGWAKNSAKEAEENLAECKRQQSLLDSSFKQCQSDLQLKSGTYNSLLQEITKNKEEMAKYKNMAESSKANLNEELTKLKHENEGLLNEKQVLLNQINELKDKQKSSNNTMVKSFPSNGHHNVIPFKDADDNVGDDLNNNDQKLDDAINNKKTQTIAKQETRENQLNEPAP